MSIDIDDSITRIRGISAARAGMFSGLGINSVGDLLEYYPRRYEDRREIKRVCDLTPGDTVCFSGVANTKIKRSYIRRGMSIVKITVTDFTACVTVNWFNQDYVAKSFDLNAEYIFYGRVEMWDGELTVANPMFERADKARFLRRILPVYPLTRGVSQNLIRGAVLFALENIGDVPETLPPSAIARRGLMDINRARRGIHFPDDDEHLSAARRRLVFDQFYLYMLRVQSIAAQNRAAAAQPLEKRELPARFTASLPYELTGAQRSAIDVITRDMSRRIPMRRLLQGDVGSGKTVVAAAALLAAYENGAQGALMAPTEILAAQHYETLTGMYAGLPVRVALLTGGMKAKDRAAARSIIKSGGADIIVGTHALIQEGVEFSNLRLIVTDEQHRFGVHQRDVLSGKGMEPHTLVMSATPIPRTLAMIIFADLDLSILNEMPKGRMPVKTYVVDESYRERIDRFMLKQISLGRQVYVICPLVAEDETGGVADVETYVKRLRHCVFCGCGDVVGMIHGRLSSRDKKDIMARFAAGEIKALVSTTVVEVGVNVPNATLMIIENAERFGLSQLHQLRGRVGRGEEQGYCVLFNAGGGDATRERLNVMASTGDGFAIAEYDLATRGHGDLFGTRQHGLPALKIGDFYADADILQMAKEEAEFAREK